jgi:hypothetical protein
MMPTRRAGMIGVKDIGRPGGRAFGHDPLPKSVPNGPEYFPS